MLSMKICLLEVHAKLCTDLSGFGLSPFLFIFGIIKCENKRSQNTCFAVLYYTAGVPVLAVLFASIRKSTSAVSAGFPGLCRMKPATPSAAQPAEQAGAVMHF